MNISSKLANKGYRNDPHICRVIHTMNTEYSSIHALRNLFQCHRHPFLLRTAAPTHKLGQCLAAHVALDCDLLSRFMLEVAIILPFLQTQTCRLSRVV